MILVPKPCSALDFFVVNNLCALSIGGVSQLLDTFKMSKLLTRISEKSITFSRLCLADSKALSIKLLIIIERSESGT